MQNELLIAIQNHVAANQDSDFAKAIADRLYPSEAPQDETYPCGVVFIVSDVDGGIISGELGEIEFQFNLFSNDFTEATNLGTWCKKLFAGAQITTEHTCFDIVYLGKTGATRQDDADPWGISIMFNTSTYEDE